jgi:hypothetical protein
LPADEQDRAELNAAVERARRRVRLNQILREAAWGTVIALLGPTFLLLAGRQWFAWPFLVVFGVAGVALAAWRLAAHRATAYQVSLAIDTRLSLQDQISTAIFFLDQATVPAVEQRQAAARLAAAAPIEQAFPLAAPRSLYAVAAVFAVASALWAIRFLLEKPLTLEQPLPQVIQQALLPHRNPDRQPGAPREQLAAKNQPATLAYDNPEALVEGQREPGQDPSQPTASTPDPEQGRPDGSRGAEDGAAGDPFGDPTASEMDDAPIQSYEDMLERDAKSGLSKAEGKQGSDQESNNGAKGGDSEASSLLSKLRDAMNNMLSKMQQKPQGNGKPQQATPGAQSNAGEPQDGRGEGQNGAGQPQQGGQQAAEGEGAETDQAPNGAGAAAKAGAKGADGGQKGSSGEGAGRQDGDKSILEAQQQEAMGKLSELYGRRAQTVSGEVTVEAQPGKQTLRTPLSAKQGAHQDAGGQVSRDEIPLAYQSYIKEYFTKIRQAEKK